MKRYEPFEGVIGKTVSESTPWWPTPAHPGEDAPNVIVILIDDLGFGHFNCFGSDIETPRINQLANEGLRFTNYHVTPLCSPTRAALMTGRNHHEVGMRSISNFNTGFPHMRGSVSNHAGTMAEVLRGEGYTTFMVGKWHLCPMDQASAAGPFDQWPLSRGFDRFYGFMDGETDQFSPDLTYDNHRVDPPKTAAEGYHLTEDLVDHAMLFVRDAKSLRPDRPFFMYFALGATHAPHQAPERFLQKYRGKFDDGWDAARERTYARQLEMGLIPPNTELAPRNPGVEPWDSLPDNQKRLAARLQEAFAGFLEHTDEQIGRLIDALSEIGELDNTIIVLQSDNGASQEGGPFGVMHEMKFFNLILETPDEAIANIDDIGGPHSHTNYPWGWAQAGNTPFKWYKQNTHEGGVHVPLIIRYPKEVGAAAGEVRDQFHHVTDIAPTIYDIIGVTPPATYHGYEQMPISGTSLRYAFQAPTAPTSKKVQYFEMTGHRAIYADGWKAVTRHEPGTSFDEDNWELYHVAVDRSECTNLASEQPDKLAELIALWWREADEHLVLPLDDRGIELFGARFKDRTVHPESRRYVYYPPISPIPSQASAAIGGRTWNLDASAVMSAGDHGVIFSSGTENSGLAFFVKDSKLIFDYNAFDDHTIVTSSIDVPVGEVHLGVRFRRTGRGGNVTLVINDTECGSAEIPLVLRTLSSVGTSFGISQASAVSREYHAPFTFTGKLRKVEIELISPKRDQENDVREAEARSIMGRQ